MLKLCLQNKIVALEFVTPPKKKSVNGPVEMAVPKNCFRSL